MPLWPLQTRLQTSSTRQPSEVTAPMPVTTTRRFMEAPLDESFALGNRLFDVVDGLTDGLDLFRGVVGDVDVELLFEFHHQFDGVQGIGPQIVDERGLAGNLVLADAKLLGDDINHTFFD